MTSNLLPGISVQFTGTSVIGIPSLRNPYFWQTKTSSTSKAHLSRCWTKNNFCAEVLVKSLNPHWVSCLIFTFSLVQQRTFIPKISPLFKNFRILLRFIRITSLTTSFLRWFRDPTTTPKPFVLILWISLCNSSNPFTLVALSASANKRYSPLLISIPSFTAVPFPPFSSHLRTERLLLSLFPISKAIWALIF